MSKKTAAKETAKKEAPLVRELEPMQETKVTVKLPLVIIALAIIVAGGITGYVLAQGGKVGRAISVGGTDAGGLKKVVGVDDPKTFPDQAEGTLQAGGVDGEGSHHLTRPGGPSQTVYLTSSTIALDDYIGKKVKVWGQTFQSEKAGWFMDVGRLELLE